MSCIFHLPTKTENQGFRNLPTARWKLSNRIIKAAFFRFPAVFLTNLFLLNVLSKNKNFILFIISWGKLYSRNGLITIACHMSMNQVILTHWNKDTLTRNLSHASIVFINTGKIISFIFWRIVNIHQDLSFILTEIQKCFQFWTILLLNYH
jgi:hypothetical protein